MFHKYKLPFLLLGLGIGILLTSILYTLNPVLEYREYTEEEIVAKATELGMVFLKENIDVISNEENHLVEEGISETDGETIDEETTEEEEIKEEETKEIVFVIETGDSLIKVSKGLEKAGVVDNAEEFLQYAKDRGVARKLRVGVYNLSTGLDYDGILSILMKLDG